MHKLNMRDSLKMVQRIIDLLLANFEQNYRVEFVDSDEIAACEMRNYRIALDNIARNLLDNQSVETMESFYDKRIPKIQAALKSEKNELQRAAYMGEIRALYMFLSMLD